MNAQHFIRLMQLFLNAMIAWVTFAGACAAQGTVEQAHIEIPSANLLGKSLGCVKAFDGKVAGQVLPESIHFDLDGDVVYGLIATYSDKVKFEDLIDAINRTQKKWWRDSDRKMADHGVSVWRNEKSRVAYQASGSQVIMLWINRRVTDREARQFTDALIAIEAAKLQESTEEQDDGSAD